MAKTKLDELYYNFQEYEMMTKAEVEKVYRTYCEEYSKKNLTFDEWYNTCYGEDYDGGDYYKLKEWLEDMKIEMASYSNYLSKETGDWRVEEELWYLCDELRNIKENLENKYGWSKGEIDNLITKIWGEEGVPECAWQN